MTRKKEKGSNTNPQKYINHKKFLVSSFSLFSFLLDEIQPQHPHKEKEEEEVEDRNKHINISIYVYTHDRPLSIKSKWLVGGIVLV